MSTREKRLQGTRTTVKPKPAMESLIADFTKSALERSKEMSEEEFDRTVKESHEIIDRRVFPTRLTADG
jgi:hypothetical protein